MEIKAAPMGLKDWLIFLLIGVMAGGAFMWTKLALRELSPLDLLVIRFAMGVTFLAILTGVMRPRWPRDTAAWVALVAMGVFNVALPHFLLTWGQQFVDSAMAGILNATTPVFTLVIAHWLLSDERMSAGKLTGAAISFAGVVLVLSRNLGGGVSGNLMGQLAILLACVLFAASSVVARRFAAGISPLLQALLAATVAELTIVAVALPQAAAFHLPVQPLTWLALVPLGLVNTGSNYVLFFYMLNRIGPTRIQSVGYLMPFVAVLLGVIFLGEPVHWRLVVGGVLILGGIALANQGRRERAALALREARP
jgi:drug/metabolite transporter (DMT)-like permease